MLKNGEHKTEFQEEMQNCRLELVNKYSSGSTWVHYAQVSGRSFLLQKTPADLFVYFEMSCLVSCTDCFLGKDSIPSLICTMCEG